MRLGVKRSIDILVSVLMIALLSPLLVLAALAVLIGSGRPILYRQTRIGFAGQPFVMLKFRTMTNGSDLGDGTAGLRNARSGPLFKMSDDPRVTVVGRVLRRLSIDELPQLFNILQGSMSLVGPRPALPEEVAGFPPELRVRESMPQGLTGLWQLEGRLDPDFETYMELDLRYVETWSLHRDLWILLRTPFVVLRHSLNRTEIDDIDMFPPPPPAGPTDTEHP